MLTPLLITILALASVVLFLANIAATSGYTSRAPSGHNAVGAVVLIFASIGGGIAMLIATWVLGGAGALAWITPRAGVATLIASGVTLGIAIASAALVMAWMERAGRWIVPVGFVCGGLAPIGLGVALVVSAWTPSERLATSTPFLLGMVPLAAVGAAGLIAGLIGIGAALYQYAANEKRRFEQQQADEARWEAKRARPPIVALREDFAEMGPTTPLWCFIAGLPDTSDPECRAFIIERSLQVPDFDNDLASTLTNAHPRYRHGCLDLIRFATDAQLKPEWSSIVVRAIAITAEQIRTQENWLTPDHFSNPDPTEHLRALAQASRRFAETDESRQALADLRQAIESRPPGPRRDAALQALTLPVPQS